jgi:filamentous hemagglutinin
VQDFHTYHIGELGVWVHNADCCDLPSGFVNENEFKEFGQDMFTHFEKQGYTNVRPIMQGSAVTGQSYRTGEAFDVGRTSDFDVALASNELLDKAKALGIGLRSEGSRTGPLKPKDLEKLGLSEMAHDLSKKYGRDVNFMIFDNVGTALKKAPSIEIKK